MPQNQSFFYEIQKDLLILLWTRIVTYSTGRPRITLPYADLLGPTVRRTPVYTAGTADRQPSLD